MYELLKSGLTDSAKMLDVSRISILFCRARTLSSEINYYQSNIILCILEYTLIDLAIRILSYYMILKMERIGSFSVHV